MYPSPSLDKFSNIVELARWQADNNPGKIACTFLKDGENQAVDLTFQALDLQARRLAVWLQTQSKPGDRVLLLCPPSVDFIIGLYGCLYAGVTFVLTGLPRANSSLGSLEATADQSQATLALTTAPNLASISTQLDQSSLKKIPWLAVDQIPAGIHAEDWRMPEITHDSLASLVFTSGSTSTPKGVMISYDMIYGEIDPFCKKLGFTSETVFVTWAPFSHIGGIIVPLIMMGPGLHFISLSTQAFLERPIRWINAMSRYRATASMAYNFVLQQCIERTTLNEREGLDLSQLTLVGVGSERIRPELLEKFSQILAPYGFHHQAIAPLYGLTETMSMASGIELGSDYRTYYLDQAALEQNQIRQVEPNQPKVQIHVGCGSAISSKPIVIVDPVTCLPCSQGKVGEIWIATKNISRGYWKRPTETQETFQAYVAGTNEGPFFRSGDMGAFINNDLIITGRIKEMIILHGKNFYSQDLEKTIDGCHPAIVSAGVAAFAITAGDEERLGMVCEIKGDLLDGDADSIIRAVRTAVARDQQQAVYLVALVKAGTLPRTASGKLQRVACREALLAGSLLTLKVSQLETGEKSAQDRSSGYVAPSTPIERALVGIWSSILGKSNIGVTDNFFELGGDSLSGTQILAQVQDVFQIELPAKLPFESPTIASMANAISEIRKSSSDQ